jgi:hypothetical protein
MARGQTSDGGDVATGIRKIRKKINQGKIMRKAGAHLLRNFTCKDWLSGNNRD